MKYEDFEEKIIGLISLSVIIWKPFDPVNGLESTCCQRDEIGYVARLRRLGKVTSESLRNP